MFFLITLTFGFLSSDLDNQLTSLEEIRQGVEIILIDESFRNKCTTVPQVSPDYQFGVQKQKVNSDYEKHESIKYGIIYLDYYVSLISQYSANLQNLLYDKNLDEFFRQVAWKDLYFIFVYIDEKYQKVGDSIVFPNVESVLEIDIPFSMNPFPTVMIHPDSQLSIFNIHKVFSEQSLKGQLSSHFQLFNQYLYLIKSIRDDLTTVLQEKEDLNIIFCVDHGRFEAIWDRTYTNILQIKTLIELKKYDEASIRVQKQLKHSQLTKYIEMHYLPQGSLIIPPYIIALFTIGIIHSLALIQIIKDKLSYRRGIVSDKTN